MTQYQSSVVIVGAGPAGLTLAHLLSRNNIDTILLEKLPETMEEPRAIAMDGESLRALQAAGVIEKIEHEMLSDFAVDYVNADGKFLFGFDNRGKRPYGYSVMSSFDQGVVDRLIANALLDRSSVRSWFGHELIDFEQDDEGVSIQAKNAQGENITIRCQFLIGCDGGQSLVRKKIGATMQGESNDFPWLVIDTIDPGFNDGPECRFYCDPQRPGMTMKKKHNQRRWEWMLMPGESPDDLLQEDKIKSIIAPYTDTEQVTIFRKRVYNFSAIVADRWQQGRVFLAGDAAHMTPPFAGQGLNAGIRDVRNLSWKLAMVLSGHVDRKLLDSYEIERKELARQMIEYAVNLGKQIQPIDPEAAAQRDQFFAEINKSPEEQRKFVKEFRKGSQMRRLEEGLVMDVDANDHNGQLFLQPKVSLNDGQKILLDELLGDGFAILGYGCDPSRELDPALMQPWQAIGLKTVTVCEKEQAAQHEGMTGLCNSLLQDFIGDSDNNMFLLRPDRFCMAAFNPESAAVALKAAEKLIFQ